MSAYGLWALVLINSAVFIIFAFSFTRPRTARDWRSFGAFSAFVVALFTEMYGFPLTIYVLSGWLGGRYPLLDPLSHDAGHLWHTLFRMKGNPHFDPFHILSNVFIFGGFFFLASGWEKLYRAQREHKGHSGGGIFLYSFPPNLRPAMLPWSNAHQNDSPTVTRRRRTLATTGAYAYVRHPQYVAFIVIMFGFLLQWPTLLTLVMFPVLVWMYVRLARNEERDALKAFGEQYVRYAQTTPAFFPRLRRQTQVTQPM